MMFHCLLDCIALHCMERMQATQTQEDLHHHRGVMMDESVRLSFSFETRQAVDGVVRTVLPPSIQTNKRHMDDGWHPHHHILKTSSGQTDFILFVSKN